MTPIMKGGVVRLVIFSTLLGLALFDLYLVSFKNTTSSISAWLTYVGIKSPFIAFVLGACAGHFFPMGLTGNCPKCDWDLSKTIGSKNGS